MIPAPSTASPFVAFPQDAAQTLSYPFVQLVKCIGNAMPKVFVPARRAPVDVFNDGLQALGPQSSRLLPDGLFEFIQTLLARPPIATFEVVAQKIKTTLLRRIDKARFGRMQD